MHGTNWRRGANFRNGFQSFSSSDLHHFAWDFTREVTKPQSIILESFRRFGGLIHLGRIIRVLAIQWGAPFSEGVPDLQGLRVDLEIWTPGLSLQLPDLSVGIFLGVIGHIWQQGRNIEELQHCSRTWHLPTWRLSIRTAQIYLYSVFIVYPAFGGLL